MPLSSNMGCLWICLEQCYLAQESKIFQPYWSYLLEHKPWIFHPNKLFRFLVNIKPLVLHVPLLAYYWGHFPQYLIPQPFHVRRIWATGSCSPFKRPWCGWIVNNSSALSASLLGQTFIWKVLCKCSLMSRLSLFWLSGGLPSTS